MPFDLSLPTPNNGALSLSLELGQVLYVLGANGTGKSSLLQRLYAAHQHAGRRISAHRQTWFASNAITLSANEKRNVEGYTKNEDSNPQSRWMDNYSSQRASIAIYDLVDAENVRARSITGAVDSIDLDLAKKLSKDDAPLKIINELLKLSNIPIDITVREAEQVMASRNNGPLYSISELSDGERNALLIAASVLTCPAGRIIFVDEPERHLHRSIISPLLTLLFAKKSDCAFVISTHDVMLPLDNPLSKILMVRSCTYENSNVTAWEADLLPAGVHIDEDIKIDILGSRRKILFVEGKESSLDKPLYSLLFPQMSVVPKETCRAVEHAVASVRDGEALHWIKGFGIVDNDRRPEAQIAELQEKGVYAVPVFSVESIYYHIEIMRHLALKAEEITGAEAGIALDQAVTCAIAAVRPHIQRLSERVVESEIRQNLMSKLPKRADISRSEAIEVKIDVPSIVSEEIERLTGLCDGMNIAEIIARYPVRETPALRQIALKLGFQNELQYENSVRRLLVSNTDVLGMVRGMFGTLQRDIEAA